MTGHVVFLKGGSLFPAEEGLERALGEREKDATQNEASRGRATASREQSSRDANCDGLVLRERIHRLSATFVYAEREREREIEKLREREGERDVESLRE